MDALTSTGTLRTLAITNCLGLGLISGVALGMYFFSVPIILGPQQHPSLTMTRQLEELVTRGFRYIQTASRIELALLALLAVLYSRHPSPDISQRWKYFAWALGVHIQAAWYEIYFVFPINDRVVEIRKVLEQTKDEKAATEMRPEIVQLLRQWRWRHIPRIIAPFVALNLSTWGIAFS